MYCGSTPTGTLIHRCTSTVSNKIFQKKIPQDYEVKHTRTLAEQHNNNSNVLLFYSATVGTL